VGATLVEGSCGVVLIVTHDVMATAFATLAVSHYFYAHECTFTVFLISFVNTREESRSWRAIDISWKDIRSLAPKNIRAHVSPIHYRNHRKANMPVT
jgi:hypothetical protein